MLEPSWKRSRDKFTERHVRCNLEPSRSALGASRADLGPTWGRLKAVLAPSWGRLGVDLGLPGAILGHLGASCCRLGAIRGASRRNSAKYRKHTKTNGFERILKVQAVPVGPCWAFLARLHGMLRASSAVLGPCCNRLGAMLGDKWT